MTKMAGRNVDADMELAVHREEMPLPNGFRNDIAGKGGDQVVFFSDRDKNIGRNPSLSRVIPAQQDLNPHALLRTGI